MSKRIRGAIILVNLVQNLVNPVKNSVLSVYSVVPSETKFVKIGGKEITTLWYSPPCNPLGPSNNLIGGQK